MANDKFSIDESLKKITASTLALCYDDNVSGILSIEVSFSELLPLLQLIAFDKQASFRVSIAFDINNNALLDDADIAIHLLNILDTGMLAFLTPIKENASTVPTFIEAKQVEKTIIFSLKKASHPALVNITPHTQLSVYAFYAINGSSGYDEFPDLTFFTADANNQELNDGINDVNDDYNAGVDITQIKVLMGE